jgi:hypothetical protein
VQQNFTPQAELIVFAGLTVADHLIFIPFALIFPSSGIY